MIPFFKALQLNRYFLGFVFLFAYAQSIESRILFREVNAYTFTPEAALFTFVNACLIFVIMGGLIKWDQKKRKSFSVSEAVRTFIMSLFLYLIVMNLMGILIALAFDTVARNFNEKTVRHNTIDHVLDVCIYGSFFLAHFFYQRNKKDNEQLAVYNQALSESKITQLKAQLNPHFLFNNLNVLDQLIEEDRKKASDFLNDFAELYRYVVQVSDKKLIAMEEELFFAQSYFRIMKHKYGNAYSLTIKANENSTGFIPPMTLQLLLENAIEHNLGTEQHPVHITIALGEKIVVTNTIIKKSFPKKFGGRALENLKEQYRLLSDETITIVHEPMQFSVSLPFIGKETI